MAKKNKSLKNKGNKEEVKKEVAVVEDRLVFNCSGCGGSGLVKQGPHADKRCEVCAGTGKV